MKTRLLTVAAGAIVVLSLASYGAHADPGNGNGWGQGVGGGQGHNNAAPAPLLAAGIPAFMLLGGGVAGRRLWRRFARRS
jgi:hypothetical protein